MRSLTLLINHLKNLGILKNPTIISALEEVDRKNFIPTHLKKYAYEDIPLSIGYDQTISQPFTTTLMMELLNPKRGEKILDIGSGSGYTTALLAHIVGEDGYVIGTEIIPELVAFGKNNLAKYNITNAEIHEADEILGSPERSPYDKILVSASATEIPKTLIGQLKNGGTIVIPVNNSILKIDKSRDGKSIKIEKHKRFVFVPLIDNSFEAQNKTMTEFQYEYSF